MAMGSFSTADERRSSVLVFFTFVANAYLLTFAASSAVALVDEIWFAAAGTTPLTEVRNWFSLLTVVFSLLMVVVVALVPQLPKLVFVPLIVAALWFAFGAPPLVAQSADRTASLGLAFLQMILATTAFLIVQLRAGQALLNAQLLPRKNNVFLRIALASLVVVALIPIGLAGLGAWALVSAAEQQTNGYLRFTWSEIQAREMLMRKDDKTVYLVATAHIAEASFYKEVYKNVPAHAVILAEGISDVRGLLGGEVSRGEAATFLGLDTQAVLEDLMKPTPVETTKDVGASGKDVKPKAVEDKPAPPPAKTRPDVVRADIDVSELSATTLRCLREDVQLGNAALDDDPDTNAATPTCTEADRKVFWDEILYTRNNKLMAAFDALADKYEMFVVPWGALHMPDLQRAFEERGYRAERSRMLTLARYQTVAGHVFGGLSAFKLRGPANRPYDIRTAPTEHIGEMPGPAFRGTAKGGGGT
jgi:hypothetical protein